MESIMENCPRCLARTRRVSRLHLVETLETEQAPVEGPPPGEQVEGVRERHGDGGTALLDAARASREVDDQTASGIPAIPRGSIRWRVC